MKQGKAKAKGTSPSVVCRHEGCGYALEGSEHKVLTKIMLKHEGRFMVHQEHWAERKSTCELCIELVKTDEWSKEGGGRDDVTCRHVGCGYYSSSPRRANRKQAVDRHEVAFPVHCGHFLHRSHECGMCQDLLKAQHPGWHANAGKKWLASGPGPVQRRLRTKEEQNHTPIPSPVPVGARGAGDADSPCNPATTTTAAGFCPPGIVAPLSSEPADMVACVEPMATTGATPTMARLALDAPAFLVASEAPVESCAPQLLSSPAVPPAPTTTFICQPYPLFVPPPQGSAEASEATVVAAMCEDGAGPFAASAFSPTCEFGSVDRKRKRVEAGLPPEEDDDVDQKPTPPKRSRPTVVVRVMNRPASTPTTPTSSDNVFRTPLPVGPRSATPTGDASSQMMQKKTSQTKIPWRVRRDVHSPAVDVRRTTKSPLIHDGSRGQFMGVMNPPREVEELRARSQSQNSERFWDPTSCYTPTPSEFEEEELGGGSERLDMFPPPPLFGDGGGALDAVRLPTQRGKYSADVGTFVNVKLEDDVMWTSMPVDGLLPGHHDSDLFA